MAIWYELWGADSGNAIGDFATEQEALAFVAQYVEDNGREAIADWMLGRTGDDQADDAFVTAGEALADRATRQRVAVGN